jgi:hypothetical protein
VDASILVSCSELLELVHVSKLQVIVGVSMETEANKQSILIKVIIYDFFTCIDMDFIIENKREGSRGKSSFV